MLTTHESDMQRTHLKKPWVTLFFCINGTTAGIALNVYLYSLVKTRFYIYSLWNSTTASILSALNSLVITASGYVHTRKCILLSTGHRHTHIFVYDCNNQTERDNQRVFPFPTPSFPIFSQLGKRRQKSEKKQWNAVASPPRANFNPLWKFLTALCISALKENTIFTDKKKNKSGGEQTRNTGNKLHHLKGVPFHSVSYLRLPVSPTCSCLRWCSTLHPLLLWHQLPTYPAALVEHDFRPTKTCTTTCRASAHWGPEIID